MSHRKEHIFSKSKLCTFFATGTCPRGRKCRFAHGVNELRATPDLSRTKLCPELLVDGGCSRGASCTFAHCLEELRVLDAPSVEAPQVPHVPQLPQMPQVPQLACDVNCMFAPAGDCMLPMSGLQFSVPQASAVGSPMECSEAGHGTSAKALPSNSFFTTGSLGWTGGDDGGSCNTTTIGPMQQSRGWPNRKINPGVQVSQYEIFARSPSPALEQVQKITGLKCRVQNSFPVFEDSGRNLILL